MANHTQPCVLEVHRNGKSVRLPDVRRPEGTSYAFGQFGEEPHPILARGPWGQQNEPNDTQIQDSCGDISIDSPASVTGNGGFEVAKIGGYDTWKGEIRTGVVELSDELLAHHQDLLRGVALDVLESLAPRETYVLKSYLGFIDELTQAELARVVVDLGLARKMTVNGIKKMIPRAMKKLRKEFRRRLSNMNPELWQPLPTNPKPAAKSRMFVLDEEYWRAFRETVEQEWVKLLADPREEVFVPILTKESVATPAPLKTHDCKNEGCNVVLLGRRRPLFRMNSESGDPRNMETCPLCRAFKKLGYSTLCPLCITQKALNGYCDTCFAERLAGEWLKRRSPRVRAVDSFDERVGANTVRREWHLDFTRDAIGFKSDVLYSPIDTPGDFRVDSADPRVRVYVEQDETVLLLVFLDTITPVFNLEDLNGASDVHNDLDWRVLEPVMPENHDWGQAIATWKPSADDRTGWYRACDEYRPVEANADTNEEFLVPYAGIEPDERAPVERATLRDLVTVVGNPRGEARAGLTADEYLERQKILKKQRG
jgi:hypothetical protein